MKLATWQHNRAQTSGILLDDGLHAFVDGVSVLDLVQGTSDLTASAVASAENSPPISPSAVQMLAPLQPSTVRDFAAFEEHVEGVVQSMGGAGVVAEWYETPVFYFSNPYAITGPYDDIPMPPGSSVLDYEL